MAVRKISEFEEVLSLKDNDRILLERNGKPKFIKASNLLSYFNIEAPTFSGVINITGDQVLNTGGDNNIFAYDKCEGIYNWVSSRDFENITITYKGNIYKYTTKVAGEYLGLFITEFSEEGYIQIYGQTANASTFDFTLMIMSDNVTSDSFPEEVKEKDNVVLYCGDIFGILNTDLPVIFNVENNKVVSVPTFNIIDNKVDITFDKNSVIAWANMPNEHWTDKNEKNGYLRVNIPGCLDWFENKNSSYIKAKINGVVYQNIISSDTGDTDLPISGSQRYWSITELADEPGVKGISFLNNNLEDSLYLMRISNGTIDSYGVTLKKDDFIIAIGGMSYLKAEDLPLNIEFIYEEPIFPDLNYIKEREVNVTFKEAENTNTGGEAFMYTSSNVPGLSDWLQSKDFSKIILSINGREYSSTTDSSESLFKYTLMESADEYKDFIISLSFKYDYIYNSEAVIAIEALYITKQTIGDIENPLLNNMAKDTIGLVDLSGTTDTILPLNMKFIYTGE